MKLIQLPAILALAGFLPLVSPAHDRNAPLNEGQKQFLSDYEAVRAALAADDLHAAQKSAAVVGEHASLSAATDKHAQSKVDVATRIAKAKNLEDARDAFKTLSRQAAHLADRQKGYYLAHCPMVPKDEGDWVQTTKEISNPYTGKAMPACGTIVSASPETK